MRACITWRAWISKRVTNSKDKARPRSFLNADGVKKREREGSIFGSAVCDGALVGFLDCNLARLVCVSKRGRADGGGRGYRRVEIIFEQLMAHMPTRRT